MTPDFQSTTPMRNEHADADSPSPKTQLDWMLNHLQELNPKALRFVDPTFDEAIIGIGCQYSKDPVLVYDEEKMIEHLVWAEGWDFDEAYDFLCFNTFSAWMGEGTPIILKSISDF